MAREATTNWESIFNRCINLLLATARMVSMLY
jgi:hypothetical protein